MTTEQKIAESFNLISRAALLLEGIKEYEKVVIILDQAIDIMQELE